MRSFVSCKTPVPIYVSRAGKVIDLMDKLITILKNQVKDKSP